MLKLKSYLMLVLFSFLGMQANDCANFCQALDLEVHGGIYQTFGLAAAAVVIAAVCQNFKIFLSCRGMLVLD